MENKHIIIILLVIIIILAAAIGVMLLTPKHVQEPSKMEITSKKTQNEGGKVSILLTDYNDRPISKEIVNITITNSKGKVVVDDVVKTTVNGKAKLKLDLKKGKYTVNVLYGGNENYTGCNATQKLKIKEKVVESQTTSSTPSAYAYKSDGTPMYSQAEVDNYMLNKYGMVNYHVGSNGYIDMDEPGYDDAGNPLWY